MNREWVVQIGLQLDFGQGIVRSSAVVFCCAFRAWVGLDFASARGWIEPMVKGQWGVRVYSTRNPVAVLNVIYTMLSRTSQADRHHVPRNLDFDILGLHSMIPHWDVSCAVIVTIIAGRISVVCQGFNGGRSSGSDGDDAIEVGSLPTLARYILLWWPGNRSIPHRDGVWLESLGSTQHAARATVPVFDPGRANSCFLRICTTKEQEPFVAYTETS